MIKFLVGVTIGAVLGYMLSITQLKVATNEVKRARSQVALYFCTAIDLENIIKGDHPDWYWWDESRRPKVDCAQVFEDFYERNQKPAEMAWLDTAP